MTVAEMIKRLNMFKSDMPVMAMTLIQIPGHIGTEFEVYEVDSISPNKSVNTAVLVCVRSPETPSAISMLPRVEGEDPE